MGVRITDRGLTTRLWPPALMNRVLFKPLRGLETDPSCVGLAYEDVELMGVRLYEALPTRKTMLTVPGAMHNDVFEIAGAEIARRIAMGESGFDA